MMKQLWLVGVLGVTGMASAEVTPPAEAQAVPETKTEPEVPKKATLGVGVLKIDEKISDAMTVIMKLHDLLRNEDVKAIVLLIDSPGGTASASWAIFEEIKKAREQKSILAFVVGNCASGAYLIASAAHYIIASPGSAIGSVGVRWSYMKLRNMRVQLNNGVADAEEVVLTRGNYKVVPRNDNLITPDEHVIIGAQLDTFYTQFLQDIADMRPGLSLEEKNKWAEGKVFSAKEALDLHMIDELGSYTSMLVMLRMLLSKKSIVSAGEVALIYSQYGEEKKEDKKCCCGCGHEAMSEYPQVDLMM